MGRLMSRKKRKKQSDIHQEDIEVLSEEGFEESCAANDYEFLENGKMYN